MKYHKLRNVDLKTCTVEQKIAANLAFFLLMNTDIEKNYKNAPTGICKDELIQQGIELAVKIFNNTDKYKKYDIDSTICALRAGLENYILSGEHIFTSYKQIGKIFPAYYLN